MTPTAIDLAVQCATPLISLVVVPWAIMAYQKRTGVAVTDQQRAAIYHALDTAKGLIETQIDQGTLKVADVTPFHEAVLVAALDALARVPDAAAAQKLSLASAAAIIIGAVNTAPRPSAIVVPAV